MFEYAHFSKVRRPNLRGMLTKESISNGLRGCAPRKTIHKFTTNLGVKFTFLDNNIVILAIYFVMQLNFKLK